jgi:hypothetical protein
VREEAPLTFEDVFDNVISDKTELFSFILQKKEFSYKYKFNESNKDIDRVDTGRTGTYPVHRTGNSLGFELALDCESSCFSQSSRWRLDLSQSDWS